MLASMYKFNPKNLESYISIWKNFAKRVIREIDSKSGGIIIIYDRFYNDESYRTRIFKKLGLNYISDYLKEKRGWAQSSFSTKVIILDNEFNRYLNFKNDFHFGVNQNDFHFGVNQNDLKFNKLVLQDCELINLFKNIEDIGLI